LEVNDIRFFALTCEVFSRRFRAKEEAMPKDEKRQGIVLDEKAQEQPADKDRAQKATETEKDDELQPLREKSGF
jgi:hypothetical protein